MLEALQDAEYQRLPNVIDEECSRFEVHFDKDEVPTSLRTRASQTEAAREGNFHYMTYPDSHLITHLKIQPNEQMSFVLNVISPNTGGILGSAEVEATKYEEYMIKSKIVPLHNDLDQIHKFLYEQYEERFEDGLEAESERVEFDEWLENVYPDEGYFIYNVEPMLAKFLIATDDRVDLDYYELYGDNIPALLSITADELEYTATSHDNSGSSKSFAYTSEHTQTGIEGRLFERSEIPPQSYASLFDESFNFPSSTKVGFEVDNHELTNGIPEVKAYLEISLPERTLNLHNIPLSAKEQAFILKVAEEAYDRAVLEVMKENAFEEFDDVENGYISTLAEQISDWVGDSSARQDKVAAFFPDVKEADGESLDEFLADGYDASDLLAFAKENGIKTEQPYLIYLSNDNGELCYGEKDLLHGLKDTVDKYKGEQFKDLKMLVCNVDGITYYGAVNKKAIKEMQDIVKPAKDKPVERD